MNVYLFGHKRAYYGSLHGPRKPLKERDFTVARFDLVSAILKLASQSMGAAFARPDVSYRQSPVRRMPCYQRDLRRMLGVAASTLTEMLQALEDKGWLTRWRDPTALTYKLVKMTEKGLAAFEKVERWMSSVVATDEELTPGYEQVEGRDGRDGMWWRFFLPLIECDEFDEFFREMIARFGDCGPYRATHPDD
mgnify:CR=1 FL=1